jgi:hypothetical protein
MLSTLQRYLTTGAPSKSSRWLVLFGLIGIMLAVFILRTWLAKNGNAPRVFEIFETFTLAASAGALTMGFRTLTAGDWLTGAGLGLLVGVTMPFATLFNPYPFWGLDAPATQGILRGGITAVALWGGLVIMRHGGPVRVSLTQGHWRKAAASLVVGVVIGLPVAILNGYANTLTQHRPFIWQSPVAAALDALQPAVVEEAVYRFAFLGLIWLVLRRGWSEKQASWLAGLLSLSVHSFAHVDDQLVTQPLMALGMGSVMALIWGVPPTILALRRDFESAVSFHWIQDFVRFLGGL